MSSVSKQAQAMPSTRNPSRSKWVFWAAIGLAAFVAMGVPMMSMMIFMGQMTESMRQMVVSVDRMSADVSVMKDNLVSLSDYMKGGWAVSSSYPNILYGHQ